MSADPAMNLPTIRCYERCDIRITVALCIVTLLVIPSVSLPTGIQYVTKVEEALPNGFWYASKEDVVARVSLDGVGFFEQADNHRRVNYASGTRPLRLSDSGRFAIFTSGKAEDTDFISALPENMLSLWQVTDANGHLNPRQIRELGSGKGIYSFGILGDAASYFIYTDGRLLVSPLNEMPGQVYRIQDLYRPGATVLFASLSADQSHAVFVNADAYRSVLITVPISSASGEPAKSYVLPADGRLFDPNSRAQYNIAATWSRARLYLVNNAGLLSVLRLSDGTLEEACKAVSLEAHVGEEPQIASDDNENVLVKVSNHAFFGDPCTDFHEISMPLDVIVGRYNALPKEIVAHKKWAIALPSGQAVGIVEKTPTGFTYCQSNDIGIWVPAMKRFAKRGPNDIIFSTPTCDPDRLRTPLATALISTDRQLAHITYARDSSLFFYDSTTHRERLVVTAPEFISWARLDALNTRISIGTNQHFLLVHECVVIWGICLREIQQPDSHIDIVPS